MPTDTEKAAAVIDALRGLQLGDTVEMLPYGNTGTGEIIGISEYSGSFQVYAQRTGAMWFTRSELRLV